MVVTEAPAGSGSMISGEDGKSASAGVDSPKKATYGLTVGIPMVADPRLSGDRYGKVRKIADQTVRYSDHHLRRRVGNFHGNPRHTVGCKAAIRANRILARGRNERPSCVN